MRRSFLRWLWFSILFPLFLFLGLACSSPCEDLANKVCDCQSTRAKKERCRTTIDAATQNLDLSSEEEDRCQAILDSGRCSCDALQALDYAACGLADDAFSALQ